MIYNSKMTDREPHTHYEKALHLHCGVGSTNTNRSGSHYTCTLLEVLPRSYACKSIFPFLIEDLSFWQLVNL